YFRLHMEPQSNKWFVVRFAHNAIQAVNEHDLYVISAVSKEEAPLPLCYGRKVHVAAAGRSSSSLKPGTLMGPALPTLELAQSMCTSFSLFQKSMSPAKSKSVAMPNRCNRCKILQQELAAAKSKIDRLHKTLSDQEPPPNHGNRDGASTIGNVRLEQMSKKLDKLIELCSAQSDGGRTVGQVTEEGTPQAEPQDRLMEERNGIATGQDGDEGGGTCHLVEELPAVTINKQRLIAIQANAAELDVTTATKFVTKELLIELIGRDALTCDSGSYVAPSSGGRVSYVSLKPETLLADNRHDNRIKAIVLFVHRKWSIDCSVALIRVRETIRSWRKVLIASRKRSAATATASSASFRQSSASPEAHDLNGEDAVHVYLLDKLLAP
ncbi:hypothetical protein BOX15_Mlig030924g1, partial [Macrostomum lignano]